MPPRALDPLAPLNPAACEVAAAALERARSRLGSRAVWHVNFSRSDGVAEMIRSLLSYDRGGEVNTNWLSATVDGFGPLLRRLYHRLYGTPGDEGELGRAELDQLEELAAILAPSLLETVRPGDVVYLHDPPSTGLIRPAKEAGARVVWRCHIGVDEPNEHTRDVWNLLRPWVTEADRLVFTRDGYVWEGLAAERVRVLQPSLDPFTPKNQDLAHDAVHAAVRDMGLAADGPGAVPTFVRLDGSRSRIGSRVGLDQDAPVPAGAPVVAQVSGWERLKDPAGLIDAFATGCRHPSAHLVVVGPGSPGRPGTNEENEVLHEAREARAALPATVRSRVHLVQLPMDDPEENAAMVNAIQRWADVIAHKSLREAFGISVAEAMWKGRPVVASDIGGIRDQIVDGESGVLADPVDHAAFGAAIDGLLEDPELCNGLGAAANARIRDEFLITRHLVDYLGLLAELAEG